MAAASAGASASSDSSSVPSGVLSAVRRRGALTFFPPRSRDLWGGGGAGGARWLSALLPGPPAERADVVLTSRFLAVARPNNNGVECFSWDSVWRVARAGTRLSVHALILPPGKVPSRRVTRRRIELVFACSDEAEAAAWEADVRACAFPWDAAPGGEGAAAAASASASAAPARRRRALVIVNPFGGSGRAPLIFNSVRDILEEHLDLEVLMTERRLHALEHMRDADLSEKDLIVSVSGDGVLCEIVNGLMQRADRDAVLARVVLAPVPAGTGNGLAASLGSFSDAQAAALFAVRGHTRPLDLMHCRQPTLPGGAQDFYAFLNLIYGIVSDVDAGSERVRWLGSARYDVAGAVAIFTSKPYHCKLAWLPEDDVGDGGRAAGTRPMCTADFGACAPCRPPDAGRPAADFPDDIENLPPEWRVVEDDFVIFIASNVPFAALDMRFNPYAHLSDGRFDVTMTRGDRSLSLFQMLQVFTSGDLETGVFREKYAENFRFVGTKALVLWPGATAAGTAGPLMVDGEHIPCAPIVIVMLPQILRVAAAPPPLAPDHIVGAVDVIFPAESGK